MHAHTGTIGLQAGEHVSQNSLSEADRDTSIFVPIYVRFLPSHTGSPAYSTDPCAMRIS